MASKQEYYTSEAINTWTIDDTTWRGNTFTPGTLGDGSFEVSSVKVFQQSAQAAAVGDTLTAAIYATSGGKPTGDALSTGTTEVLSTGSRTYEITMSTATLASGTQYALVFYLDVADDIVIEGDASDGYAGGTFIESANAGTDWTIQATWEIQFEVWGNPFPLEKYVTKRLVYFSGDKVYHGTDLDNITEFTDAASDISTANKISAFEAEQKCLIANKDNLKVIDYVDTKITTAAVGDHPPDFGTLLTDGTSGAEMIVQYITSLTGACTIYGYKTNTDTFASGNTVTGTDDDGNAISFALNANEDPAPHWYTWTEFGGVTTNIPSGSIEGCYWRGRAVLVDDDNRTQFNMSRVNNLWDFDADTPNTTDALRPYYGALGDTGKPGDVIMSLIPFNDNYLIFACSGTIYLLVGDPASGGQCGEIKGVGGIIDSRAWTWDDKGNLYILTHYGLMRVPKGFGSFENLTEEKYPEFVDDVDFDSNSDRLVLQYDVAAHGIEIAKTNVTDGTNSNWFFDPRTNGLFKDAYPTDQSIHCATYFHAEDPAERLTVYGCKDGYLRYFDPSAENDDGTAIDSYIDYGPIQLADGEREGIIFSVDAELADGASESDDVTWRLWVDESADDIVKALSDNTSPNLGGTFREGRRRGGSSKRKARGVYAGIKLRNNTSGESWAMEKLLVGVRPAGRLK